MVQKAAQRSSHSHVCPGASKGEIMNRSELLLLLRQLETSVPVWDGQPLCNMELHSERFRWRWIWDPHDAEAHLPSMQVSALACLSHPPSTSSSCQGERGLQSAGRHPILFNYMQSNSHHEEVSQEEMPLKSAKSCCIVRSEREEMLSLAYTHHPGVLHLPHAGSILI